VSVLTIPGVVADAAQRFAEREGLVDGDVRLSFAELAAAVERATRAFIASGIEPGDRVAMWAPNMGEWVVAGLGALGAGAVLVPINTRFKGAEAAYILEKSGASTLLTVTGFLDTDYVAVLAASGADLPALRTTIVLRGDAPEGTRSWQQFVAGGDGVTAEAARRRAASVKQDDLSDIIFTSGTTGRPKGVMTTHAQTVRVFTAWSDIVGLTEGDRYLIVNPFFHTFGYKAGIVACLIQGATIIPHAVFDVPSVLARVQEERVTMLPGPPTLYQTILNDPDRAKFDLSSLRLAVTGAAVVPVEMIKRMRTDLTFQNIVTGYGLTEVTGTATMCRPSDDPETIATTSGRAIPDVEVRVVDDSGGELPRGEPGEVVVRGYNVMLGYLDDDDETKKTIDADGWLHTGDIGVMNEHGYIRITDRKKDMFIAGGFNAYPAEIENVLLQHPHIAQVAVVGVPDDRLGEVGAAFVIARAGEQPDPDEIRAWAKANMANYKVPRTVTIVDTLPMNASGKVLKYELREQVRRA
jgi:acyl-CoA synthetase (AMP-forming)/AMP-acid ligase II